MKRMMLVAAVAAMHASAALGQDATVTRNLAKKFGEAVAADVLCDRLELNSTRLALYALALGFTGDDLKAGSGSLAILIDAEARIARNGMAGKSEESVCAAGEFLYGENGANAKGLLVRR